jgi:hypothetical protein
MLFAHGSVMLSNKAKLTEFYQTYIVELQKEYPFVRIDNLIYDSVPRIRISLDTIMCQIQHDGSQYTEKWLRDGKAIPDYAMRDADPKIIARHMMGMADHFFYGRTGSIPQAPTDLSKLTTKQQLESFYNKYIVKLTKTYDFLKVEPLHGETQGYQISYDGILCFVTYDKSDGCYSIRWLLDGREIPDLPTMTDQSAQKIARGMEDIAHVYFNRFLEI